MHPVCPTYVTAYLQVSSPATRPPAHLPTVAASRSTDTWPLRSGCGAGRPWDDGGQQASRQCAYAFMSLRQLQCLLSAVSAASHPRPLPPPIHPPPTLPPMATNASSVSASLSRPTVCAFCRSITCVFRERGAGGMKASGGEGAGAGAPVPVYLSSGMPAVHLAPTKRAQPTVTNSAKSTPPLLSESNSAIIRFTSALDGSGWPSVTSEASSSAPSIVPSPGARGGGVQRGRMEGCSCRQRRSGAQPNPLPLTVAVEGQEGSLRLRQLRRRQRHSARRRRRRAADSQKGVLGRAGGAGANWAAAQRQGRRAMRQRRRGGREESGAATGGFGRGRGAGQRLPAKRRKRRWVRRGWVNGSGRGARVLCMRGRGCLVAAKAWGPRRIVPLAGVSRSLHI